MLTLDESKMIIVRDRMIHFDGNRTKTSMSLKISIKGLSNILLKMKEQYPDYFSSVLDAELRNENKGIVARKNNSFKHRNLWDENVAHLGGTNDVAGDEK